jgi:SPP1 gp7 family putative phage head morphogenesis protein
MDEDPVETDVSVALQRPVHQNKLQLLYSRNFEALQGITEDVSREISRELAEGLAEGVHPDEMATRITGRIDAIGKTRATTLARTETMYAHNEATISTYENVLGDIEVEIVAEVMTAGDQHVCDQCSPWHGETMSLSDARREGPPFHPRCRCIVVPQSNRSSSAPATPAPTAS